MSKYSNLFAPMRVGNTTFRNRIFATPTSLGWADYAGAPMDNMIFYYEDKARGGAAAVTMSETTIDRDRASRGVGHYIVSDPLYGDPCQQLSKVAAAVARHGAVPSIQIHHAGDVTWPVYIHGKKPIGPNSFTREDGIEVKAMDEDTMHTVAANFAEAALAARRAGFGMVQIHGAHGWLLAQFMSAATNHRTDRYGGSLENRARFPIMVLKAIREQVGSSLLLEYRMSGDEHLEGGMRKEEAAEFGALIQDYVDIIHVSAGSYYTARQYTFPGIYQPHGINTELAAAMKRRVRVPVATVGAHNDPSAMDRILAEGKADFIAIGRGIIADPDLPNKYFHGLDREVIPCIRCSNCLGGKYVGRNDCDVNPISGNELYTMRSRPVIARRRVLVVGGGPGGMKAAVTAAQRGHEVILVERSDALGGMLKFSDLDKYKGDLKNYKDYLIRQVHGHAVDVRLNTEATPDLVAELAPYAIIAAVGADPIRPDLPGIDGGNVMHAVDVYANAGKIGNQVVMIGGGLVGCEVAVDLATDGHRVTVVELRDEVAADANIIHRASLMEIMDEAVSCRVNTRCTGISDRGVTVVGPDGAEELLEADTVIYAVGMRPNTEVVEMLRGCEGWGFFMPIGDCVQATRVKDAVHGGYHAAMDIV